VLSAVFEAELGIRDPNQTGGVFMNSSIFDELNRREFIKRMALTGAAAYVGFGYEKAAADPPPETTRIRFFEYKPACWIPQHLAEDLLHKEGFTDVQYIKGEKIQRSEELLQGGELDIRLGNAAWQTKEIKSGDNSVFIAGLHTGCYSLISSDRVRSIQELKGKNVWAGSKLGYGPHLFFSVIVSYIGLDPNNDINFVEASKDEALRLFSEGKIDAVISFPPGPTELREKKIGHVLLDTNVDKPWSQYFCCMVNASKKFVRENPIATKRALRAILKANDIVARDPELATRVLIEKKIRKEAEYKYILQSLKETPYYKWRDYNPEDTVRFYALRLRELGLTKLSPQEIIAENTDWRFINSLKKELNMTFI
jgi:NitT/TauT family transport system substrate-binding protein